MTSYESFISRIQKNMKILTILLVATLDSPFTLRLILEDPLENLAAVRILSSRTRHSVILILHALP